MGKKLPGAKPWELDPKELPEDPIPRKRVAEILERSESRVYQLMQEGEIKGYSFGRQWVYSEKEIREYARQHYGIEDETG